ncbi:hypothetical protein [Methylotenera sp.]|uniref:hypothetical protein n=1 Tax=Methylotenera sp. TaxID=2051956 RepID=UPI002486DBD3|nr:hypothetical protein [Methylotenera sp.]MDI1361627.1 hypothetical protein [Methylotenera sp.]
MTKISYFLMHERLRGICDRPEVFHLNQPKNLQGALADLGELVLQAATNACLL